MEANDARVTVRLNADGGLAGLDIEGDIDRTNLVEERRPVSLPADDSDNGTMARIPGLG